MNTNNFKIFVEALEALPDEIKNNQVDMLSIEAPVCGTAGCFTGLISIVAEYIPALKEQYTSDDYCHAEWKFAINSYLGCIFPKWARDNPKIWGNEHGELIFYYGEAFGENVDELTHNDIIIHLRIAFDNWIAFENKSNEHQYPTEK